MGYLDRLLTDVDEIARGLALARYVRLEISVDAMLQFAGEGLVQQSLEALQTVRVVGQTELTDFRNILDGGLWHMDGVVQSNHMGLAVDPQH